MKITILLTAYKEYKTIAKAIDSLMDSAYSNYNDELVLIQISPDDETLKIGKQAASKFLSSKVTYKQVKDPQKGKPFALNLGLKEISKDSDFVVLTDGDVYFDKGALSMLIAKLEGEQNIGAVSGRPVSIDDKNSMMGYFGHLFADANDYRRRVDLESAPLESAGVFVRRHKFFPLSGYIMAIRFDLLDFVIPEDALVDDAYISYMIFNKGKRLAYASKARVFIKYPKHLADYYRQKKRSTGGYIQLWKYGVVKEETKSRSPWQELEMFWFPFKYASNLKELIWSTFIIPVRAWLWLQILFEQKILHKDFTSTWVRVESTK